MSIEPGSETVKIDVAHADLIAGLVRAAKPRRVLELGFGGGRACRAILQALAMNRQAAHYLLVDNWVDWAGEQPKEVELSFMNTRQMEPLITIAEPITADEKGFVELAVSGNVQFDFIMSDADHHHAHEWFWKVYLSLLMPGGTLVYHDVDGTYPGLAKIPEYCKAEEIPHKIFDKSSRPDERCGRGLLVIFKPEHGS